MKLKKDRGKYIDFPHLPDPTISNVDVPQKNFNDVLHS